MRLASPARLLPPAYRPLLADRRFSRLLAAFAASDLGDGMSAVTVAWLALLVAPPGQQGLWLGAAVAAYALPGALGALVFARLLRRLPPRRLLAADSTLRAVLLGSIPLAYATGVLHPVPYVCLLGGSSLLHAWGGAGKYALVAQMLPGGRRLPANALLSASGSVAVIAGPAVAGFLVAAVQPAWVIGLDALSFAVLAVYVARLPEPHAEVDGDSAPEGPGRAAGGLRLLRGQRELLGILALTWLFYFVYGPVETALPLLVAERHGAGAGLLGVFWALFGVGAVLGGLASGTLRALPLWPVLISIVAGWGAVLVPFGFPLPAAVLLVCFTLGGLVYGPFNPLSFTLFQNRTPAGQLTTVLAVRGAALLAAAPLGTALGGPLTAALGPRRTLALSGTVTVALAAVAAAAHAVGTARGGAPGGVGVAARRGAVQGPREREDSAP